MHEYQGKELELFENATNWKNYFASFIKPYLKGSVLEVGAGIGGTTKILCDGSQKLWTCLEPASDEAAQINSLISSRQLPSCCVLAQGTIKDVTQQYDVILYIDVIEHIEDDKKEIEQAVQLLNPGGLLIILAPAYQWLYSPFDKAIGHYRRYNKRMLCMIIPDRMHEKKVFYADVTGVAASVANKILLKRSYPSVAQIQFWDRYMIPVSKILDIFFNRVAGRSVVGIWEK